MEDLQTLIDRMLEIENLTDNLQDEDAQWLLDWGTAELHQIATEEGQEGDLSGRASALMKFMRGLNRLMGGLPAADPAELARLLESRTAAYGKSRAADESAIAEAVATLSPLPPRQALEFLISWARAPEEPI